MLQQMKATIVLEKLLQTNKRFTLLVGSSRSSKTWSMLQWIIIYCARHQNQGKWVSIVRKSFPSLRRTVYRDFVELLGDMGLYSEKIHNKSEHVINLFGNYVEFFSIDNSLKVRGAKRDILFMNESNEIGYEAANQLFLRTYDRVFMDQNPSDIWHFSYKMRFRDDCDYIHCFIGKTPVLTDKGYKRIDRIKVGDFVMTRNGYKKVLEAHKQKKTFVKTYKIGDKKITCTPDHKFYTEEYGFKSISDIHTGTTTFLIYNNKKGIWQKKKYITEELNSLNMNVRNTMLLIVKQQITKWLDYIGIFGRMKLVKSLRVTTFTTKTAIRKIMIYLTWSVLALNNMCVSMIQRKNKKRGQDGPRQRKERKTLVSGLRRQMMKLLEKELVIVERNSIGQNYTHTENTAHTDVNQGSIKENIGKRRIVYDLTIEDDHEFVVDGILVHNSTYKDNPFLTKATITQIESYKDIDENMWRVYGLGEPGYAITTVYTHYDFYDLEPPYDDYCYGLDVGYSHLMALVKCYFKDEDVWVEEVLIRPGYTSADLIKEMGEIGIEKHKEIWVDSASPMMILDLQRAGYNAKGADKSVKEGIDLIKSKKLHISNNSEHLQDELRRYSWKTKGEQIVYEPVKMFDDAVDSMRYAVYNYYKHAGVPNWKVLF